MKEAITFDDVLIVPRFSEVRSRKDCSLRQLVTLSGDGPDFYLDVPIMAANMDTICGIKMAKKIAQLGGCGILHRNLSNEELSKSIDEMHNSKFTPVIAVGSIYTDKTRIDYLMDKGVVLCVDMAHGHSQNMKDTLEYICAQAHPVVIAGNVCTPEGVEALHEWGADIVKVGIGSGSVCTTRIKTGCGFPQLQAIIDIAKETGGSIPIIADGGIRTPGDAAKALAAGAHFIMLGGMLAATDCTPKWEPSYSDWSYLHGFPKAVPFRGMASEATKGHKTHVEGEQVFIPAKSEGSTEAIIKDICEGIKSAMSYVGASTLEEFRLKAEFVRVTNAVHIENQPHKIYDVE